MLLFSVKWWKLIVYNKSNPKETGGVWTPSPSHWSNVTHARDTFWSFTPALLVLVLKSSTFCSRLPPTTASIDDIPPRASHCTCAWPWSCCWLARFCCCCCACVSCSEDGLFCWPPPVIVGTFGPGLAARRRQDNTRAVLELFYLDTLRACAVCW